MRTATCTREEESSNDDDGVAGRLLIGVPMTCGVLSVVVVALFDVEEERGEDCLSMEGLVGVIR